MDFSEAEEKFGELQARVQRGEPLSEDQYEEELAKLMVQDEHGTFWSLEPGTGRWLYFDGTEWAPGTPPHLSARSSSFASSPRAAEPTPAASRSAGPSAPPQVEPPPVEPETVPTYVRAGEAGESGQERPGGIPPRPVRETMYAMGVEERPWLPFAFGAVVLLLCAVALFFGTRTLGLFAGAGTTPVAKVTATEEEPTPTEEEAVAVESTDTPVPTATVSKPKPTATVGVVKATTTDRSRIRMGPGTSYDMLTTVDQGTVMTVIGRNADSSWIQVQGKLGDKSGAGWVSKDLVTLTGDLNTVPVIGAPTPTPSKTKAGTRTPTKAPAKPTATETPAG